MKKSINCSNSFEAVYLRESNYKNIKKFDEKLLQKYKSITQITSRIMYEKFKPTYNKVGFYNDDIFNIAMVYLHEYLGIYSFQVSESKKQDFIKEFEIRKGVVPTDEDINNHERNVVIRFIRQKLTTCSVFCERKSRNIVVGASKRKFFAFTDKSVSVSDHLIMESPKLFGYRNVESAELKEAKKSRKGNELFDKLGFKIFELSNMVSAPISLDFRYNQSSDANADDTIGNIVDIDGLSTTPSVENYILDIEEDIILEENKKEFNSLDKIKKKLKIRNFLRNNYGNKFLKEELILAKKLLKFYNSKV